MGFVIHWHESAMDLHVFSILIPPLTSLSTWSLWVFPVHQAWALVSCIQPGLVICFTIDNIHVSMLFCSRLAPVDLLGPFVLWTAGSVFGQVNFLSLFCYPNSLGCYLTKAPSDCSQGTQAQSYPKQCRLLLSVLPLLAGGRCRRLGYFSAGSCF